MKNNIIKFLHISDVHYFKDYQNTYEMKLLAPFLKSLEDENKKQGFDFICLTGDLIDKGNGDFNTSEEAFKAFNANFIDKICATINFPKENIIICPGNHDMDISRDSERSELGNKAYLVDNEKIKTFMLDAVQKNDTDGFNRTVPYKLFEKKFYENANCNYSLFETTHIRKLDHLSIGFTCINSAWRYYKNDEGLLIGEQQILNSLINNSGCDIQILLSHYPLDSISNIEKNDIEYLITENYQLLLFGHNHSENSKVVQPSSGGAFFSSVSRGLIQYNTDTKDLDYLNGFSIIEYDTSTSNIKYRPIIYAPKLNQFVIDTTTCGNLGYREFCLQDDKSEIKQLHLISNQIRNSYLSTIDEDLITSGCDTIAPSTIDELFVQPRLILPAKDKAEDKEIKIDLFSMIMDKSNYVILGLKETGKTICLDYLAKLMIDSINKLKSVPVFVDFKTQKINRWETLISRFLSISIKDVSDFLQNKNVVLLVDNLNFENPYTIKALVELLNKYPRIKLIASLNIDTEGSIPIDFLQSNLYELVSVLELKYFNTKQIRELTSKWYNNVNKVDTKIKQDKIVKLIKSLELPRTPLSISMFLWILEKQEDYQPTNQAFMIENFIEKLFNKHDIQQTRYSEFTYKNKDRLLTEIAKKMYESNQDNYSMKYTEIIDFTGKYLKMKKWKFNSTDIINEFIDVGLLTRYTNESDEYLRFRFNCFFQYFLMKNLSNSDFKKYVLSEENYLSFTDELILYTGLNPDQEELLEEIVNRMNSLYKGLLNDLWKNNPDGFDRYFKDGLSFTKKLEKKELSQLPEAKKKFREEIDTINDKYLETLPVNDTVRKKIKNLSEFKKLELSLILAANVLRNSEEINNKKNKFFKDILTNSLGFVSLYKILYSKSIQDKSKTLSNEQKKEAMLFVHCLPLLHEALLEDMMATSKLSIVYKEHIDEIINKKNITQLEKYCSVFLYADTKGENYLNYVGKLIAQMQSSYINDMVYFKLLSYYFLRDDNKEIENKIENLLADVITHENKVNKSKKSKVIGDLRRRKFLSNKDLYD